jgi:nucleotide-binding universal stress UspA family protein
MDEAKPQSFPEQPGFRERRKRVKFQPGEPATVPELDHPIVVGYDGSAPSRNALAYASGMAKRLGQPLLIVHVIPPRIYCEPLTGQVIGLARSREELDNWLLAEFTQIWDQGGLEVKVLNRVGSPARELAATAAESHADALIIGAPSHPWHHVAGSIPAWLVRHACCPVIVVP